VTDLTSPQPVAADGDGAELFSAPITFFLTYQEPILRWYRLKREADEAVHSWLLGLTEDLAALGQQHELTVATTEFQRQYQAHLLYPRSRVPDVAANPRIAFGVGWRRGEVVVDDEQLAPYVGVWVDKAARDLRERFLAGGDPPARTRRSLSGYRGDTVWPIHRRIVAQEGWWADLDGYRRHLTDQLVTVIREFGSDVAAVAPSDDLPSE
jgi:hypothetical protein